MQSGLLSLFAIRSLAVIYITLIVMCPHAGVIQTWENTIEGLNVGSAKFVNQKQQVRESDPDQYRLSIQIRNREQQQKKRDSAKQIRDTVHQQIRRSQFCAPASAHKARPADLVREERAAAADPAAQISAAAALDPARSGAGSARRSGQIWRWIRAQIRPDVRATGAQISPDLCRHCGAAVLRGFGHEHGLFGQGDNLKVEEDPCLVAKIGNVWLHEQ
ncbi:hypothetical protein Adt_47117 [Abeliophyllum distichum]|uniref:Secreted protein n=1 Tax=Abeliophyllum distichum TaxID=126358 RepID=A0ABD1NVX9_9LAMI